MTDLPLDIQKGIKEGFAELPQKVLWKFESDLPMTDKHENIYTRKWFPQYDVISKNEKLPSTYTFLWIIKLILLHAYNYGCRLIALKNV